MSPLPSPDQMAVRSYDGHYKALNAFRDEKATLVGRVDCDWNETVIQTLRRWKCLDGDKITQRGLETIAAYEKLHRLRRCTCGASDYASCGCDLYPTEWLAHAQANPQVDQGLTLSKEL